MNSLYLSLDFCYFALVVGLSFFLGSFSQNFFLLDQGLLRILQFPKIIFMTLLLFKELVFHFVVISEEKHLPVDQ